MKRLLILSSLLIFPLFAFSQDNDRVITDTALRLSDIVGGKNATFSTQKVEVEGNPYLTDGWMTGTISKLGKKTEPLLLRINLLDNSIEAQSGSQFVVMDENMLDKIEITQPDIMVFKNGYELGNSRDVRDYTKSSLFEVLYEGDITILKKEKVRLLKDLPTYGSAVRKDALNKSAEFFYSNGTEFNKIKLNRKDITGIYGKDGKKVEKYAKDNKLKFDDKTDLKKILTYADSLK